VQSHCGTQGQHQLGARSLSSSISCFTTSILNEVGTQDIWLIMAVSATWGYGSTGAYGFNSTGAHGFNRDPGIYLPTVNDGFDPFLIAYGEV
jgi:hypothetical protein